MAAPPVEGPSVEFNDGINGLYPVVTLRHRRGGCSAEILRYGGQIISWKNQRGEELLFLSEEASHEPPHPIRGGIQIFCPKVFDDGNIENDGFDKIGMWKVDNSIHGIADPPSPEKAFVNLILTPTDIDSGNSPHRFEFRLRVVLEPSGYLTMVSRIKNLNTDGRDITFNFSYQNHFSVSDIGDIRIEGLEKVAYLQNKERFTQGADAITFESEVDRVYLNIPVTQFASVIDPRRNRYNRIYKTYGLPDIGVWNPWEEKARAMDDLGNEEYRKMVRVDVAVFGRELTMKPFREWTGAQHLISN